MACTKLTLQIIACVLNALLFTGTVIVNFTNSGQFENQNSTDGQFANYTLDITPATWAFSIWGLIYTWQAAWIVYSIINLFRGPDISLLIPLTFLLTYMGSHFANASWIFVAFLAEKNKVLLPVSTLILWTIFGFLAAAMIIISLDLQRKRPLLLKSGHRWDPWLVTGILQNGVGMYLAWCSVAAPLNTAISLCYYHRLEMTLSGTIALGIVAFEIVLFLPFDLLLLDKWTRYLFTPYLTLIWALIAIWIRHGDVTRMPRNSVFTLTLLCVSVVAAISKLVALLMRHRRDPKRYGRFADLESAPEEKGRF